MGNFSLHMPLMVSHDERHSVRRISLDWTVGYCESLNHPPTRFFPAQVPGAVQCDYARAHGWPPYWYGENFRDYAWMEDCFWIYRATLRRPELSATEDLVLVCEGVDYACRVRVGGNEVLRHEGMFSRFEVDLTSAPAETTIELIVSPAPKAAPSPSPGSNVLDHGRREARQCCKPAVSYGWDFHPRLIPLGIWQDTYLEVRARGAWLTSVEVACELTEDFSSAFVNLMVEGHAPEILWRVLSPEGDSVVEMRGKATDLRVRIDQPRLWWPAGEGPASLYTSIVSALDTTGKVTQTIRQRFGIRRLHLVMAPGQFDDTNGHPASQPPVPITFEVNGRPIFARGANWVCPEIFPGLLTPERYREQIDLVTNANLNFLRCWGGAIVNKEAFFDLCDERGILVWQEFPLACNRYEGTPEYLRVLDAESRAIIQRLRRRACLAVWCGGNELFNAWSGMTMQDAALRLLGRNCYDLDPTRPFLPTSPLIGIRHGDYRFLFRDENDQEVTVFQAYRNTCARALLEFGISAPPSVEQLRTFIPEDQLWPVRKQSVVWRAHHAFGAWCEREPGSWLYPETAERFFGKPKSLEQLIAQLQLLQAEGYKAIYEEARRQKPFCSAAACWVFNEPWPAAANNSLVAWPNHPKPAYFAVKAANRPVMVSARVPRFDWARGATLTATLFLLNDSPADTPAMSVRVLLVSESGEVLDVYKWKCPGGRAGRNFEGPEISMLVPTWDGLTFELVLDAIEHPDYSSRYTLAFQKR